MRSIVSQLRKARF